MMLTRRLRDLLSWLACRKTEQTNHELGCKCSRCECGRSYGDWRKHHKDRETMRSEWR